MELTEEEKKRLEELKKEYEEMIDQTFKQLDHLVMRRKEIKFFTDCMFCHKFDHIAGRSNKVDAMNDCNGDITKIETLMDILLAIAEVDDNLRNPIDDFIEKLKDLLQSLKN